MMRSEAGSVTEVPVVHCCSQPVTALPASGLESSCGSFWANWGAGLEPVCLLRGGDHETPADPTSYPTASPGRRCRGHNFRLCMSACLRETEPAVQPHEGGWWPRPAAATG